MIILVFPSLDPSQRQQTRGGGGRGHQLGAEIGAVVCVILGVALFVVAQRTL